MSDRAELLILEAIRLEVRAASYRSGTANREGLQRRANKLARMAFDNTNLANDEREALGYDVEPPA